MSDALQWISLVCLLLVAGGVSSFLVQRIKGSGWSSRTKYVLSIALSIATGTAGLWLAGDVLGLVSQWGNLTAAQVFAFLSADYVASTGFYEIWFKRRAAKSETLRR